MANRDKQYPRAEGVATISPQQNEGRLLGSLPLEKVTPLIDDDFDIPFDPPTEEPEIVSVPDLAFQFQPCLESLDVSPEPLEDALQEQFGPDAHVKYACIDNRGTAGVWTTSGLSGITDEARQRGLERIDVVDRDDNFGLFLSTSYLRRLLQERFDDMAKRYSGKGAIQGDGPIHLTGIKASFDPDKTIVTTVSGFDERPWPDIEFKLVITEQMLADVEVDATSQLERVAEPSWKNLLALFLPGNLRFNLFIYGGGLLIEKMGDGGGGGGGGETTGLGSAVAGEMPRSLLVPAALKLIFSYDDVEVTRRGVFANGDMRLVAREPEVSILGARTIVAKRAGGVSRKYSVRAVDLRDPLTIEWNADGAVRDRSSPSTEIFFDVPALEPGSPVEKTVSVKVTDTDGVEATTSIEVGVFAPVDDPSMPGICLVKPDLPQCDPTGGEPGPGEPIG